MISTVGQLLINDALPEDLRSSTRVLDKKGIRDLLHDVSVKYPDKYREIAQKLNEIGREVVYRQGSSFSLSDLKPTITRNRILAMIGKKIELIRKNPKIDDKKKSAAITKLLGGNVEKMQQGIYDELLKSQNPFAIQVKSGSRGSKSQLNSLVGTQLIAPDANSVPIPIPIMHSYSEGLDPGEYWAASYGARSGLIDVKFATQDAGFLGKQLNQAAHRSVITEEDCGTKNGIMVDSADTDNVGSLLASKYGTYAANTVMTPLKIKAIAKLKKRVMVRSPITCQSAYGICQKCSGIRSSGRFPAIGDNIGIPAASALAEKLSQGQLSAKHSATGGAAISGFDYINQMIQVPRSAYKDGAAHSIVDGRVTSIETAPQGGKYIVIGDERHYVPEGQIPNVKVGEEVEAGDVMSDGIPNPSVIVEHKGIGEGRKYFADLLKKAFNESGMQANRRNTEVMARSLINHVRVLEADAGLTTLPNDVVEYDAMSRNYEPRHGSKELATNMAIGKYLERPAMHYSIGTRITKRTAKALKGAGFNKVMAHVDKPSFAPSMFRAQAIMGYSPDWLEKMLGVRLKENLLKSVGTGATSDIGGISFVPKLVTGEI
jgi:DNA-directed RNA polymerase subunit beta'